MDISHQAALDYKSGENTLTLRLFIRKSNQKNQKVYTIARDQLSTTELSNFRG